MSNWIKIRVPATTANLGPAFDCMGVALNYYNTVEACLTESGVGFEIAGVGDGKIPENERNIIYTAFAETARACGKEIAGVRFRCNNKIALNHGMGSSSAAIVSGVFCADRLLDCRLSREQMVEIATRIEGHPDNVAPAVLGGITVSAVNGSSVSSVRFLPALELSFVVAVPDYELPTRLAREALPKYVQFSDAVFNVSRAALLTAALHSGDREAIAMALDDRLHQPHRAYLMPGMKQVFHAALKEGALGAVISGAGPTMLAIADARADVTERIAAAMQSGFEAAGKKAVTHILSIDGNGACEE